MTELLEHPPLAARPPGPVRPRALRPRPVAAVLLGVAATLVSVAGSATPSYWGDEAASVMSATRPWASLAAELGTIDAVHGVYYAFLHLWVGVFGTSELSTRFPSALAVGFATAGVVTLMQSLGLRGTAVVAGAVCMFLPRMTAMGIEARSYAIGTAAATWVTVLLVRLAAHRAQRVWWIVYGVAMAASVYVFLYLGLLLVVHAIYLVVTEPRMLRRWVVSAAVALLLAGPLVATGFHERSQIRFLARRHYVTPANIFEKQWFGSLPVALIGWIFIAIAIVGLVVLARRRRPSDRRLIALGTLATAWLVVPSVLLLLGDLLLSPMYNVRYLSSSTPAAAILMALGIRFTASALLGRTRQLVAASAMVAVLLVVAAPTYVHQRSPWAKDGGSDWRQVGSYVRANAAPGDAIVFDQTTKPSRDPRLALRLYPDDFAGLRDVELKTAFGLTNGLWDHVAPLAVAVGQAHLSTDVWAIELVHGITPDDVVHLESVGYRVESAILIHRTTVYHLTRKPL